MSFFRLLEESFWTQDPSSRSFILFMLIIAAGGALQWLLPLEARLRHVRTLRKRMGQACDGQASRDGKEREVRGALENSLLSAQWDEFIRRWKDARGDLLHDRAPVRFLDVLRRRGFLPEVRGMALLPALPGVLLGLGILGTFLGLTQALPHAGTSFVSESRSGGGDAQAESLVSATGRTQQRIDQQIDGMTTALALAFKTSLWGLSLSMLLTLWVRRLEGGYSQEEAELDRVVHSAFEWVGSDELGALALHSQAEAFSMLRTEFSTLSVELSNVLGQGIERMQAAAADSAETARKEQAEALGKIAQDLSTILEQGLDNIARSSADAATLVTNEQREALAEIVTEIGDKLREGVGEQVTALVEAVESARRSQAEVTSAIAKSLEQVEASSSRHAELLSRIDTTAEALSTVADKTIHGAREAEPVIARLMEAGVALRESATAASAVQEASRQGLDALQQVLQDSRAIVEEQRRLAESSMEEMQSSLKMMSDGLGDSLLRALREVDGVLAKAVQRVAGTTAETSDTLERLGEPIAELNERFAAVADSVEKIGQAIEQLGSGLEERLRSVNEAMERAGDRVGAVSEAMGEGLESRLAPTRDALVEASRAMHSSVARLAPELDDKVSAFKQAIEDGSERFSSGAALMVAELAKVCSVLLELQRARPNHRSGGLDGASIAMGDDLPREVIELDDVTTAPVTDGSASGMDVEVRLPQGDTGTGGALGSREEPIRTTAEAGGAGSMPSPEAPGDGQPRFLSGLLRGRR